ncbi:hypothetical protein [Cupriavidus agavae]|uniref:Uncharacterized protein n=1 Tax=Cupriavidus agavae TaxID=1001822 RepID=A0A4Q7RGY5_9BURK|nr:hypothetical protein [Cupriavidus agavae]RZT31400.1 hypothetical protein EV147_4581 [Cupriavidus agavae]
MLAKRCIVLASLLMLAPALAAAQVPAPALPDPMNPHAAVPALPDVAPLAGYQRYETPQRQPWRAANASVAPAAGAAADPHAGHAMHHASPPPASTPAGMPASPAPADGGHQHHHAH